MKLDTARIFQERYSRFAQEAIHYWQLIFRSGVAFLTTVFVLLGMIYYQQLMNMIPPDFPLALSFALLLAFLVTRGRHRTFVQEADLVFLTPIEGQMKSYFSRAYLYNFVLQGTVVFLVLFILFPLYHDRLSESGLQTLFYFLVPLLLKGWNLHTTWSLIHVTSATVRVLHTLFRCGFNFLLLYWFFNITSLQASNSLPWAALALAGGLVAFYLYERRLSKNTALHWYELLKQEAILNQKFYQFVSAFIEVPKLPRSVKKRAWITALVRRLPYKRQNAYRSFYLYHFLRTGDHFGRYVRLTLIGSLAVVVSDSWYVKLTVAAFFLMITRVQLKGLQTAGQQQIWNQIFPINPQEKKSAFNWTVSLLFLTQLTCFTLSFLTILLGL